MLIEATCRNVECREKFMPDLSWDYTCVACKGTDVYWYTDEVNDSEVELGDLTDEEE